MEALLAAALPEARGAEAAEPDPWPRVHALNALRVLLDDAATSQAASPWLPRVLGAALASLGAGAWEVRNAAGLAAAQLVRRLAGAPPAPEGPDAPPRRGAPTLRELEARHGARLAGVLAGVLEEGAGGCSSAAAASRPLAAALALLSRLRPDASPPPPPPPSSSSSSSNPSSPSSLDRIRGAVSRCARARDWGVRALAARALPPLVPVRGMLAAAAAAADEAARSPLPANHLHGLLLQVRALAAAAAWPPPASGTAGEGAGAGAGGAPAERGNAGGVAALAAAVRRGCVLPLAAAADSSSCCPVLVAAAIEAAHAACKAAAVLLTEEEEGEGEGEGEEQEEARRAARREVEALAGELGRACRQVLSPSGAGDEEEHRGEPGWGLVQRAAAAALAGSLGRSEAWPGEEDALLSVAAVGGSGGGGGGQRDPGATAAALAALCRAAAAARSKGAVLPLPGAGAAVSAALAARAGPDVEAAAFELWALLPPREAPSRLPPLAAAAEAARGGARSAAARAAALSALGRAVVSSSSSEPSSIALLLPALERASLPVADERERAAAVGGLGASGALRLERLLRKVDDDGGGIGGAAAAESSSSFSAAAEAWVVAIRLLQDEDEGVRGSMAEVAWREMSRRGEGSAGEEHPWWWASPSSSPPPGSVEEGGGDGPSPASRPPITAPDAPIMLRHAISMLASLAGGSPVVREALKRWMLSGSNNDTKGAGERGGGGGGGGGVASSSGGGRGDKSSKAATFRMYEAELDNVFEEPLLLSQCAAAAVVGAASRAAAREAAALVETMAIVPCSAAARSNNSSSSSSPPPPPAAASDSSSSSSSSSVLSWPQKETLTWAKGAAEQLSRVCRFVEEAGGGKGSKGNEAAAVPLRPLERTAPGGPATAAAVFLPAAKAAAALVGAAAVVHQEEEEEEDDEDEDDEEGAGEELLLAEVRSLVEDAARSLLAAGGSPHPALLAAVAGAARAWRVGRRSASSGEVVEGLAAKAGGRADGALFLV